MELTDPGFDSTVLSEFRTRLLTGQAESLLLDALLERCRERQWLRPHGRQRTDSTHVLGAIRAFNRVACVAETMRHALDILAGVAPEWLHAHSQPTWLARYGRRIEDDRLPKGESQRQAYARAVGLDGYALLDAIDAEDAPAWLREVPAVKTLRRIWGQHYYRGSEGMRWRTAAEGLPPATQMISSPYDLDARYAKKYTTSWIGYKVHFTESCEADDLHLITHVETTAGPVADGAVTTAIHEALQAKQLLPRLHRRPAQRRYQDQIPPACLPSVPQSPRVYTRHAADYHGATTRTISQFTGRPGAGADGSLSSGVCQARRD